MSSCFWKALGTVVCLGLVAQPVFAEDGAGAKEAPVLAEKLSFSEAAARAKRTGRPLVVFGMSDTCQRCQALKQGLTQTPELQSLLGQYVATETPFGGKEFGAIFREIVRRDKSIPPAIGAPSVFIFTSKGETVYAGPDRPSGVTVEEMPKLLAAGIEKNGGPARPAAADAQPAKAPPAASGPRVWKSANGKFTVSATLLSFDGQTVRLKTSDGRTIDVPLSSFSAEDHRFLKSPEAKP